MIREPVNLLLASLCLLSLVLAGGFIGALAPGSPGVQITLDSAGFECPEGGRSSERVIRPCAERAGGSTTLDLLAGLDLLNGLIEVSSSDTSTSSVTSSEGQAEGSTGDGSPTPAPSPEATDGRSTASTDGTGDGQATPAPSPEATAGGTTASTDGPGDGSGTSSAPAGTSTAVATTAVAGGPLFDVGVPVLLLGVIGLLVVLLGGTVLASRRGLISSPRSVGQLLALAVDWFLTMVVRMAVVTAHELRGLRSRLTASVRRADPGSLPTSLAELHTTVLGLLRWLVTSLRSLPARIDSSGGSQRTTSRSEPQAGSIQADPEAFLEGEFRIQGAWHWLADQTRTGQTGRRTPEAIARDAIAEGYPAESVRTLLRVFRDVTYGGYDPSATEIDAARDDFQQLLSSVDNAQTRSPGD